MAKCPYCNQEIEYLLDYSWVNISKKYTYDMDSGQLRHKDVISDQAADLSFKCPKCDEVLFRSIDKAKEFLKK